jgi:hypothetical protein
MSDARRKLLWTLELIIFLLLVIAGTAPILDYHKRESLAYMKEPTQQNLNALRARKNEELRTRRLYVSPLGLAAVAFAIPLYLAYQRRTKTRG